MQTLQAIVYSVGGEEDLAGGRVNVSRTCGTGHLSIHSLHRRKRGYSVGLKAHQQQQRQQQQRAKHAFILRSLDTDFNDIIQLTSLPSYFPSASRFRFVLYSLF